MVLSDATALQSQGYQGPKVLSLKVVLGSQKCFGISKNALASQRNGWHYWHCRHEDIVDIVDILEIIDILDIIKKNLMVDIDIVDIVDILDIVDSIDIVLIFLKTIWITSESLLIPGLSNLKNVTHYY